MSDLISREALLKTLDEIRKCGLQNSNNYKTAKQLLDETYSQLLKALTAIEQGEAVAIYQVYIEADGWMDFSKEQYESFASWVHKRIVYPAPQQPLSVADALEEVINLIQKYGSRVANPSASIVLAVRALIKRNAEEVESDDLKDAKRYRWLREVSRDPDADKPHCVITKEVLEKGNPARMVSYLKFDEALDAEIDRAIAVKKGE